MKSKMLCRFLTAILTVTVLLGSMGHDVFAASEPTVIYNGQKQQFEFGSAWPFGNRTAADLFPDLKGLMPGDRVTQEIQVGAKNLGANQVRIYLRAENPSEDYTTLLYTYGQWVELTVKNGTAEITGDLKHGVLLGTFSNNHKSTVSVTFRVDPEAGNALQSLVAEVDWVFTAEVLPIVDDPVIPPSPEEDTNYLPQLTQDHINYIIGYEDNLVHPEASITRAEVATIFYRLLTDSAREEMWCTESIYPDVTEKDWYYVAVCTLTNGGILKGYLDGTFGPDRPITRAELATIISRFDSQFGQMETNVSFADTEGHWAEEYVAFSEARKYVLGYPDGTFRPDQDINRAETVTMVNRCLKRAVDSKGIMDDCITWPDNLADSWYYYEIIEAANYHDYVRSHREVEEQTFNYEDWTYLYPPIDWAWVEREWLLIHTGE
jgi:hypothetical protein